jgi:hypothetical protein
VSSLEAFRARSNMDSMTASDVPSLCKAVLASDADIGFEQSASLPASASSWMMNRSPLLPSATFCNQKRFCVSVAAMAHCKTQQRAVLMSFGATRVSRGTVTRQLDLVNHMLYTLAPVTPKRLTNFRLEDELLEGLSLVKDRDGIPLTEQVRRAVRLWLDSRGVTVKTAKPARRKRADRG